MNSCSRHAISMQEDKEGFLQPIVDTEKCAECGLCSKSCPVLAYDNSNSFPTPKAFASWHFEDRTLSSSGGSFSSFARMILQRKGSVFGATLDTELNVRHIEITELEDLNKIRGSKYIQSEIGFVFHTIKQRLSEGKWILFCGTPCQVAGLKSYLRKDYDKLLTIDIVCHGVPSNFIFQKYISKVCRNNKDIKHIHGFEFRRRNGWGMRSIIETDKDSIQLYNIDNLYMSAFDQSAIFRKSCYNCKFAALPRVGDITLADFWGIGRHGIPFKHDVTKGVSLVLTNTEKGEKAMEELDENTFAEERTLNEALIENGNLHASSRLHPDRDEIIAAFLNDDVPLEEINGRYHLVDRSIKGLAKEWSSRTGLFDLTKKVYNWYKTL